MEETLGKRIAFHRKRLGLTQDALAELLGITALAVSKWENDQSCPDITMLPKLTEIFDITADELLGIRQAEVHLAEVAAEERPDTDLRSEDNTVKKGKWDALTSPGAAFAFWLFLTGLVAVVEAFRPVHCGLWDIAIACGIFTFGLFGFFRRFSVLRLGCAVAGGVFILNLLTIAELGDFDWTVPLAAGIALFGLDLLIGIVRRPKGDWKFMPSGHLTNGSSKNHCTYDGERFECATCFGEGDRLIHLSRLSGGRGQLTFGELHIDLTACGEIADGCDIALECAFGSLEILIPRQYRVEAATSTAFGTVETKGYPDPDAISTIFLKCNVSFGEITIRHI